MKRTVRLISVALTLILLFSCIGTNALAASRETVKQYGKVDENGYGGYLAIGDSVTRGCGATENYRAEYSNLYDRTVANSYPYLLAQAVGCNIAEDARNTQSNYWPVCSPGQTLSVTMDILGIEDGYYDPVYDHGIYGSYSTMQKLYGSRHGYLERAGLISVCLGLSDVFYKSSDTAMKNNGEVNSQYLKDFSGYIIENLEYWKNTYPKLIEYIQRVNPNATIVLIGNYNAGGDIPLSADIRLPVGTSVAALIGLMNQNLKQWAEQYGCIYCDITNAETVAVQYDKGILDEFQENTLINGHLSPEGNTMVYRLLLDALPEEEPSDAKVSTDIVVDLGRFTSVESVAVNGITVENYSMDGYVLTVPCSVKTATLLSVTAENEDGQLSFYNYQLVYKDGYKAYLMYGCNDVGGTVKATLNGTVSIGRSLVSRLTGLFE